MCAHTGNILSLPKQCQHDNFSSLSVHTDKQLLPNMLQWMYMYYGNQIDCYRVYGNVKRVISNISDIK